VISKRHEDDEYSPKQDLQAIPFSIRRTDRFGDAVLLDRSALSLFGSS